MWIERNGEKRQWSEPASAFTGSSLPLKGWIVSTPPAPHVPTQEETIASLTKALEAHYDAKAREKRYDSRLTCALRAGYAGPFQAEGEAFAIWMDNCNAYGYQVMAACMTNTRSIPTVEQLISELPVLTWP